MTEIPCSNTTLLVKQEIKRLNLSFASQILGTILWHRFRLLCGQCVQSPICDAGTDILGTAFIRPSCDALPSQTMPAASEFEPFSSLKIPKASSIRQNCVCSWSKRFHFLAYQIGSKFSYGSYDCSRQQTLWSPCYTNPLPNLQQLLPSSNTTSNTLSNPISIIPSALNLNERAALSNLCSSLVMPNDPFQLGYKSNRCTVAFCS